MRRLPRSTLFPYTTLSDLLVDEDALVQALTAGTLGGAALDVVDGEPLVRPELLALPNRSEEHTSELQSQSNLVRRLLLEKQHDPHAYRLYQHFVQSHQIPM